MNTTNSAGVLAVFDRQAELTRRTGSSEDLLNLHKARAAVVELVERDKAAQLVFDCLLRAVNDYGVSATARQFAGGWMESWARSMLAAGFAPSNPDAPDIRNALAALAGNGKASDQSCECDPAQGYVCDECEAGNGKDGGK